MLIFNLGATPLFDLIGPTHTEICVGLLLLATGVAGYLHFRRGEGQIHELPGTTRP
jgi:MFS transporter, DHA3 family, macrolide efflux protein